MVAPSGGGAPTAMQASSQDEQQAAMLRDTRVRATSRRRAQEQERVSTLVALEEARKSVQGSGSGARSSRATRCRLSMGAMVNPQAGKHRRQRPKQQLHLTGLLLGLCAALALLLAFGCGAPAGLARADSYGAAPASGDAGHSADYSAGQPQAPAKTKKIQIVYIKVPMAKLKPTLPGGQSDGAEAQPASSSPKNSTAPYPAAAYNSSTAAATSAPDSAGSGLSKLDGSQAVAGDEHKSQAAAGQLPVGQSQASFLIPMAVVSSPAGSDYEPSTRASDEVLVRSSRRSPYLSATAAGFNLGPEPSQNHESQYLQFVRQSGGPRFALAPPGAADWTAAGSDSAAPAGQPGFMSGFLQAEKERMTSAALRLHADASNSNRNFQPTPAWSGAASSAAANRTAAAAAAAGGGLMPVMMIPASHMPDNMIGQAYNAAVGQALPLESGSPASSLNSGPHSPLASASSTSSTSSQTGGHAYGSGTPSGGEHGAPGDSGFSPLIASGGSYGSAGLHQPDAISSASGYPSSPYASANSGPSYGYGNGINSFGASVAFTDYPTGQSSAYGTYSSAAGSSSSYSTPQSPQFGGAADERQPLTNDNYMGKKLRQAKKTIIPIVVQVEHAIMESNAGPLKGAANRYPGAWAQRQPLGPFARHRGQRQMQQQPQQQPQPHSGKSAGSMYGLASNELPAQYIDAANAHDINQITAAINAENAASAAAALAQADLALGQGGPAYLGGGPHAGAASNVMPAHGARPAGHQRAPLMMMGGYAGALQSAASALLANSHPVLQTAASGGLASVSKLGAKLGEMMALPSMQVQNSISSLPSALSSLTSQMGVQLNQAVQQVAKEHPAAHAFARQVAQQAGFQLPGQLQQQQQAQAQAQALVPQQHQRPVSGLESAQQLLASASSQLQAGQPLPQQAQAQLQNLKLSIGHNLQSAAVQLIGSQKAQAAQSAASLLANPLSALYPPAVNSALKQISGGLSASASHSAPPTYALAGAAQGSASGQQHQGLHAPTSGEQAGQQASSGFEQQQQQHQQQQLTAPASKPLGKTSLKSKFLSFFQPPKFISNLLSWNDRADARSDLVSPAADAQQQQEAVNAEETVKLSVDSDTRVTSNSTNSVSGALPNRPSATVAEISAQATSQVTSNSDATESAKPAPEVSSSSAQVAEAVKDDKAKQN